MISSYYLCNCAFNPSLGSSSKARTPPAAVSPTSALSTNVYQGNQITHIYGLTVYMRACVRARVRVRELEIWQQEVASAWWLLGQ